MKVIQILTNLNWGDAISNDVLAVDEALKQHGYDSRIMAITIHESLLSKAQFIDMSSIKPEDLVIFHKSTGDALTGRLTELSCKKGIIYHNITPAKMILPYDPVMSCVLYIGRRQLKKYLGQYDFAWGVSQYNCQELQLMGMDKKKTAILPILIKQHPIQPDSVLLEQLKQSNGIKLLFIGRISPQKKQEDIIKTYWYVLQQDSMARLFLVGKWDGMEKYYAKLKGFCADLGLTDQQVTFTGGVSEAEKEAYLTGADVLVCMSEHEGFCVPLLEAMNHDLPIVAYQAGAVSETLGDSGIQFKEKDYPAIARAIIKLKTNQQYYQDTVMKQQERQQQYDYQVVQDKLFDLINGVMHE